VSVSPQPDTLEFTTGILVGGLVGAALALLVAPDRSPRARIRKRLKGPVRRVRREAGDTGRAAGLAAHRSASLGQELQALGGEFADAIREELVDRGLQRWCGERDAGSRSRFNDAARRLRELGRSLPGSGKG
jgi:gas vesicle protein